MTERILVAEDDAPLRALLESVLDDAGFEVQAVSDGVALVQAALENVPDLLLIDIMMPVMNGLEALRQLRHNIRTAHLPMLLLTALDGPQHAIAGYDTGADDYIIKPFNNDVLIARVKANLRRAARSSVNSPLTGLPGNVLINAEVNHHLRQQRPFALLYIDMNNFKAFNDAYGFARGDHVIRLLANILRELKAQRSDDNEFIGHIGGDDFVALVPPGNAVLWAETVIAQFDQAVPDLYNPEDRERGYLVGMDRFGTPHRYPLTSVSIGIVDVSQRQFNSYTQIATVAAEVKSRAKQLTGSQYVQDERQHNSGYDPPHERRGQPPLVGVIIEQHERQMYWEAWSVMHGCRCKIWETPPSAELLADSAPDVVLVDLTIATTWAWLSVVRSQYAELPVVAFVQERAEQNRALSEGATVCFTTTSHAGLVVDTLTYLLRLDVPADELPRSA